MKEIDLEQGSEEWLAWRRTKITASMAPIIMGVSPYRTKQQLWRELMGLDDTQPDNEAMRRGRELEPMIRRALEMKVGMELLPKVFQHSEYEWLSASLDGINMKERIAIEIKTVGKADHELALKNEVPKKYIPQLQTIMAVCDLDEILYCSFYGEPIHFWVQRDQTYIDEMTPKLKEFWDSLQNFEEPEPQYKNMETNEEWNALALQWTNLQCAKKDLLKIEEDTRSALISLSGNGNASGRGLKLTKVKKQGSVDYSSITELQGVDLDKYRKPGSEYWRITNE